MPDIVKHASTEIVTIEVGLARFEDALLAKLDELGLPSDNVLVEFQERGRFVQTFEYAISRLTPEQRERSLYLSKTLAAVCAGLFDAALNYIWDETIGELRRRIASYDVQYFFEIAVPSPERRKDLKTAEDLMKVTDQDLIRAANELGLVSDIGYQQLDLIRYMRNYASAAHPNQNEVGAIQLAGWVETCIKEVINLPETMVVANIKRLLGNVRTEDLTEDDADDIAEFFEDLAAEQADNLAAGLFGMYISDATTVRIADNVRLLLPRLWDHVREEQRSDFGVKYGRHVANGDQAQAEAARELLDLVGGSAYIPEGLRAAEIKTAIEDLLRVHHAWDNFHNEPAGVRVLAELIGEQGVPKEVRRVYVWGLMEVFITNGHGESRAADPLYQELIGDFTAREAQLAALSFQYTPIASRLRHDLCRKKFHQMLDIVEAKVPRNYRELIDAIRDFSGPMSQMVNDSRMKRVVRNLKVSSSR